jgi:hypothetical protein
VERGHAGFSLIEIQINHSFILSLERCHGSRFESLPGSSDSVLISTIYGRISRDCQNYANQTGGRQRF